jgi:hypothetical protein
MTPDRDLATPSQPRRQDLATVPERPQIEPGEMDTGGPFVLEMNTVDASWKHSIGWMDRHALEQAGLWPQAVLAADSPNMASREAAVAGFLRGARPPAGLVAYDDMSAVAALQAGDR